MVDSSCLAMCRAGISDPESQEGIDFCTSECPYPTACIVMEHPQRARLRLEKIKQLQAQGLDRKTIALQLHISERSVRYSMTFIKQ